MFRLLALVQRGGASFCVRVDCICVYYSLRARVYMAYVHIILYLIAVILYHGPSL